MSIDKDMKFRVTPETSGAVQEWLFSRGYEWAGGSGQKVSHTGEPYLYAYVEDQVIRHGSFPHSFANKPFPEMKVTTASKVVVVDVEQMRATVQVNGHYYYVDEYEAALEQLTEVFP